MTHRFCDRCNGEKQIYKPVRFGGGLFTSSRDAGWYKCIHCDGEGYVKLDHPRWEEPVTSALQAAASSPAEG